MKKFISIIGLVALTLGVGNAAVLLNWDFTNTDGNLPGGNGNFGPSPYASLSVATGITSLGLMRGSGLTQSGAGATRGWGASGFVSADRATALSNNQYLSFSLTVAEGFTMSLDSFGPYNLRASNTGPSGSSQSNSGIAWMYSLDNGANFTFLYTPTATNNSSAGNNTSFDLSGVEALQNLAGGSKVTFALVGWGGAAAGTFYLNGSTASGINTGFSLHGTVAAIPEPTTWLLLGAGLGVLAFFRRRK